MNDIYIWLLVIKIFHIPFLPLKTKSTANVILNHCYHFLRMMFFFRFKSTRKKIVNLFEIKIKKIQKSRLFNMSLNLNFDKYLITAVQIHLQQALLSASFDVFGQLWTTFDNFGQLWTFSDIFWHILTDLATFGNFWRLLAFFKTPKDV